MGRIRLRRGWLLFLLLAGIGATWAGKAWLFAQAACPNLQDLLLYTIAAVSTIAVMVYALVTRNNSPIMQLVTVVGLVGVILFGPSILGVSLLQVPRVQTMYCPPEGEICAQAEMAQSLRENNKLDGAEDVARSCLDRTPANDSEIECQSVCARVLALVLYDKVGQVIAALPEQWSADKRVECMAVDAQLEEALRAAEQHGYTDLARSIEERQQRVCERCATPTPVIPSPTPAPVIEVEILHQRRTDQISLVDIRVIEDGQSRPGLQTDDFSLTAAEQPVDFDFEARRADDPVCLVAVVDDSGSIYPGLEQIRTAIEQLNSVRKPGDELGLVLFAKHNHVVIKQYPSSAPLDSEVVNGQGELTALWDGVLAGLEAARSCSADNRYLLVLTDGSDNNSVNFEGDNETRARRAANMAAAEGVDICTVGVQSDALEPEPLRLAAHGCGYYYASDFDKLGSLFTDMFGYVRDFYRITFSPKAIPPDGKVTLGALQTTEVTIDFSNP